MTLRKTEDQKNSTGSSISFLFKSAEFIINVFLLAIEFLGKLLYALKN